jgi:hypothetical protein
MRAHERLACGIIMVFSVVHAVDSQGTSYSEPKPFNPRDAIAKVTQVMSASPLFLPTGYLISCTRHSLLTLSDVQVAIYQSKHPEFAANILTWMATGARARALSLSPALFLSLSSFVSRTVILSHSLYLSLSLTAVVTGVVLFVGGAVLFC